MTTEKIIEDFRVNDFLSSRIRDEYVYFIDQSNQEVIARVPVACMDSRDTDYPFELPDLRDI